jgi:hypothetical protein
MLINTGVGRPIRQHVRCVKYSCVTTRRCIIAGNCSRMWENKGLRFIKERVALTAFVISSFCTEITVQLTVTLTT